jgi:AcrR family transcriptional regulator
MEAGPHMEKGEGRTDARQLRSRKALASALLALIEEKPFEQITVREITVRANVGYATFFRHYSGREQLLHAIASDEISELLRLTMTLLSEQDGLRSCETLCYYVDEHRRLWNALLAGGAAAMVREDFIRQAHRWIEGEGAGRSRLPLDLAVQHGIGATIDFLSWWLSEGRDHDARQAGAWLHRLVVEPLTSAGRE